jgi:hypothetical protein
MLHKHQFTLKMTPLIVLALANDQSYKQKHQIDY